MDGSCSTYGTETRSIQVLVGKPEDKRKLRIPTCRWEDNIKIDLQEIVFGTWTGLIWLRVVRGGGLL
jgi:hypothetical protein